MDAGKVLLVLGAALAVGCADPCYDDGLAQGGCPEQETDSTTGATAGSASMGSTMGSATMGSATMGSATMGSATLGTATITASGGTDSVSASGGTDTASATATVTVSASGGTDSASATATASASGATETVTATAGETETATASDTEGPADCPELREILVPQTPTIQLVVDQSGSMDEDFGGISRWTAVETTLLDPGNGVVTDLQSYVRFGVSLYTSDDSTCPRVQQLTPQLDAADEIDTFLGAAAPDGETPTGESLPLVTELLLDDVWEGDKVIVLATDGEPDSCSVPRPETDEEIAEVRGLAVSAVEAAYAQGIRTFVISVGTEVGQEHLQALANAGIGAGVGATAPYYTALDAEGLTAAFQTVIAGIRSCSLDLEAELQPEFAPSCSVTINDQTVALDDPNGWTLRDDHTSIALQGESCRQIQEGVVSIEMTCTCETGT